MGERIHHNPIWNSTIGETKEKLCTRLKLTRRKKKHIKHLVLIFSLSILKQCFVRIKVLLNSVCFFSSSFLHFFQSCLALSCFYCFAFKTNTETLDIWNWIMQLGVPLCNVWQFFKTARVSFSFPILPFWININEL